MSKQRAPYRHADGSDCWTKNCSRNSHLLANTIQSKLAKVGHKTSSKVIVSYEGGLLTRDQVVAITGRKAYIENGRGGYILHNLRNDEGITGVPTLSDFQRTIKSDLKYPYYIRVGDSIYFDKEAALKDNADLGNPVVRQALDLKPLAKNIISNKVKPLHNKLYRAWEADTSADEKWSLSIPEAGQCAVTALLVQEEYGGELNRALVNGVSHYWNTLPDGTEVDLTRAQFEEPIEIIGSIKENRDYVLSHGATAQKYALLKSRI